MKRDIKKTKLNREMIRPLVALTPDEAKQVAGGTTGCASHWTGEPQKGCNQH